MPRRTGSKSEGTGINEGAGAEINRASHGERIAEQVGTTQRPQSDPESRARKTKATGQTPDDRERLIRRKAYELYLSRGGRDGNDLGDWLEAERTIP